MKLVELTPSHKSAFLRVVEDYRVNDPDEYDVNYRGFEDWNSGGFENYLQDLERWKLGKGLKPNQTATTTYFLVDERGEILAFGNWRFPLSDRCLREGGNLSYGTPPSQRGKGYATRFLRLCLEKAKASGWDKVLVTCNKTNLASASIIEKCGGRLENYLPSVEKGNEGNLVARYWIHLT
jgi:predicted acetyltransferase